MGCSALPLRRAGPLNATLYQMEERTGREMALETGSQSREGLGFTLPTTLSRELARILRSVPR